jgi:hypothetical protein
VSVIIVNWNAKDFIAKCLTILATKQNNIKIEIIVVDNNSTDGSFEFIVKKFPQVKLIQNNSNTGFAKANNIGIKNSNGRYLCLINSDVEVLGSCIDQLFNYIERNPKIGLIGPKILNPDMTMQHSCRTFPSLWNNFCAAVGLSSIFPKYRIFNPEQMLYSAGDKICQVDALSGCFLMIRRSALDDVGMLDEDFFIYSEDIDLCKRIRQADWDIVFYPPALAIHYGGGSSSNEPTRFTVEKLKAILQYWKKHHSGLKCDCIFYILLLHYMIRIVSRSFLYTLRPAQRKNIRSQLSQHFACIHFLLNQT